MIDAITRIIDALAKFSENNVIKPFSEQIFRFGM